MMVMDTRGKQRDNTDHRLKSQIEKQRIILLVLFFIKFIKNVEKQIFQEDDEKLIVDIPKEERHLNTSSYDYSVEFLISMMQGDNPKIILEVPFQRQYVWNDDKASKLIESIIMNVPIPPIYFAEEENGKWLVVDGLQRLNSLLRYFQNEYGLKKLEILKDLELMKFKDLPPKSKSLISNGQLRVNVIKKDSHPDIKYDIFMRLNKGAVTLNYQELRNCLYRGDLNNLAKSIVSENKKFLNILGLKAPHNRFLDVEFVVRTFALISNLMYNAKDGYYINNYNGRLVTYINNYMKDNIAISPERLADLKTLFNETIDKVIGVFGTDKSFRDLSESKSKVNKALADCILISFSKYKIDVLIKNRDKIQEALRKLLIEDLKFKAAISLHTSDKDVVNYRINNWIKAMENAI